MEYCPPNSTLSDYWVNHGFGLCFFTTLSSASVGLVILVLGFVQLWFYRKYATRMNDGTKCVHAIIWATFYTTFIYITLSIAVLPNKRLYSFQLFLHWLLFCMAIVTMMLRHSVYKADVYGYEILELVSALVTWPMCVAVITVRRWECIMLVQMRSSLSI